MDVNAGAAEGRERQSSPEIEVIYESESTQSGVVLNAAAVATSRSVSLGLSTTPLPLYLISRRGARVIPSLPSTRPHPEPPLLQPQPPLSTTTSASEPPGAKPLDTTQVVPIVRKVGNQIVHIYRKSIPNSPRPGSATTTPEERKETPVSLASPSPATSSRAEVCAADRTSSTETPLPIQNSDPVLSTKQLPVTLRETKECSGTETASAVPPTLSQLPQLVQLHGLSRDIVIESIPGPSRNGGCVSSAQTPPIQTSTSAPPLLTPSTPPIPSISKKPRAPRKRTPKPKKGATEPVPLTSNQPAQITSTSPNLGPNFSMYAIPGVMPSFVNMVVNKASSGGSGSDFRALARTPSPGNSESGVKAPASNTFQPRTLVVSSGGRPSGILTRGPTPAQTPSAPSPSLLHTVQTTQMVLVRPSVGPRIRMPIRTPRPGLPASPSPFPGTTFIIVFIFLLFHYFNYMRLIPRSSG